jgi:hypothetical protein
MDAVPAQRGAGSIAYGGLLGAWVLLAAAPVHGEDVPTGAPPPDAKALVEAPKAPGEAPKIEPPKDETAAALSAGGQVSTGNSQLVAGTVNGKFELRRGSDGFGASVLGNYGRGGDPWKLTSDNVQGRLRYERYLVDELSLFLIGTGRYDRFQGLDFRLNLDPGAKFLFLDRAATSLWADLGYDFQYDIRRDAARIQLDAMGNLIVDAQGHPVLLDKTQTDHSSRLFWGFRHAFNEQVSITTGLEYLQSFVDATRYRLNYDALFAADVGAGLALGLGFNARFDHAPIPGKQNLDTATTVSLIYSYSSAHH